MEPIETRRFRLRDFTAEDAAAFSAYQRDHRFVTAREVAGQEAADPLVLIDLFRLWARERPRQNYQLAVVERRTGILAGCCGIRMAGCPQGSGELGIELSADFWGRHGCAIEIARALAAFGFRNLGLDQICGKTTTHNRRATRLAAFLGARLEKIPAPVAQGDDRAPQAAVWRLARRDWQISDT